MNNLEWLKSVRRYKIDELFAIILLRIILLCFIILATFELVIRFIELKYIFFIIAICLSIKVFQIGIRDTIPIIKRIIKLTKEIRIEKENSSR